MSAWRNGRGNCGGGLVYVADRESDLFELMNRAHEPGHPADYVLRSKHDRALPEGGRLLTVTCVIAWEVNPPEGVKPLGKPSQQWNQTGALCTTGFDARLSYTGHQVGRYRLANCVVLPCRKHEPSGAGSRDGG